MILLYWVFLSGVFFVVGSYTSRLFITGPAGADICIPAGKQQCIGTTAARTTLYVALLALLANAIHLVFHASIMTDTPLNEVPSIILPFVTKTRYGKFNFWKTVIMVALVATSFMAIKKNNRIVQSLGLIFSMTLLIAVAMSGHQGVKGYMTIPFFLDVFHLVAVSVWIGGLFLMRFCFAFFLQEAGKEFLEIVKYMYTKFSGLATYCVFAAGITGALLSFLNIKSASILFGKNYGIVLIIKVMLVGIVLSLGGINKFFVVPTLSNIGENRLGELMAVRRRLSLLITAEVYLSMGVLFVTSLLTHLSPDE